MAKRLSSEGFLSIAKSKLKICLSNPSLLNVYLDSQRKQKLSDEKQRKRKSVFQSIDEIKAKRKRLEVDIISLTSSADKFSDKAEETGQLDFIAKSNSMRRTAKEKQNQVKALSDTLEEKLQELKDK